MKILYLLTPYFSFSSTASNIKDSIKSFSIKNAIYDVCPALLWLPQYNFKSNIVGDIIAGITVAIMHIPQGMAYGLLAGLDPIVGLYMAFFPALVYFVFGTSRHISVGTFAVVSIMTSKIVATYSDPNYGSAESLQNSTELTQSYSNYQVATAVTMVCGIFEIIMSFLKMGVLASLLSTSLVSGFTTAAGE
jgi:solute carrier family 26 protein